VLRTSMEMWAKGDADVALPDLVREGLLRVRAGLPTGAPVTASQPSPAV
jgi:hypothetical protein